MVLHVLHQHFQPGKPAVGVHVRLLKVRQHHLDLLVLLVGLEHQIAGGLGVFGGRVKELLLDFGVHGQLGRQLGEQLFAVAVSLLDVGKDLLHLAVVILQQRDGIHDLRSAPPCIDIQNPDRHDIRYEAGWASGPAGRRRR